MGWHKGAVRKSAKGRTLNLPCKIKVQLKNYMIDDNKQQKPSMKKYNVIYADPAWQMGYVRGGLTAGSVKGGLS